MFTRPAQRGRGVASALLAYLEAAATARGCLQFMLETGNLQPQRWRCMRAMVISAVVRSAITRMIRTACS